MAYQRQYVEPGVTVGLRFIKTHRTGLPDAAFVGAEKFSEIYITLRLVISLVPSPFLVSARTSGLRVLKGRQVGTCPDSIDAGATMLHRETGCLSSSRIKKVTAHKQSNLGEMVAHAESSSLCSRAE